MLHEETDEEGWKRQAKHGRRNV